MDRQELIDLRDELIAKLELGNEEYKNMFKSAGFTNEQKSEKFAELMDVQNNIEQLKLDIAKLDEQATAKLKEDSEMSDVKKDNIIAMNAEVVRAALDGRPVDYTKFKNEGVEGNIHIENEHEYLINLALEKRKKYIMNIKKII